METKSHTTEIVNSAGKKYSYSFEDISLSCGFMYKILVNPLLKILPLSITPNTITICSGIFSLTAFLIMLQSVHGIYRFWWAIPILMLMYVVGDYTDGEQARRTGMCSPFGEFLDHFFDTAITCYLLGGLLIIYNVDEPFYIAMVLTIAYATQASAFWERYKNGKMFFTRFSSTESILVFTILISASGIERVREFMSMEFIAFNPDTFFAFKSFSLIKLFFFLIGAIAISSIVKTLIRTDGASWRFNSYFALSAIVASFIAVMKIPLEQKIVLISLYNVSSISTVLIANTLKREDGLPDFALPSLLLIFRCIPGHDIVKLILVAAYLIGLIGIKLFLLFAVDFPSWRRANVNE